MFVDPWIIWHQEWSSSGQFSSFYIIVHLRTLIELSQCLYTWVIDKRFTDFNYLSRDGKSKIVVDKFSTAICSMKDLFESCLGSTNICVRLGNKSDEIKVGDVFLLLLKEFSDKGKLFFSTRWFSFRFILYGPYLIQDVMIFHTNLKFSFEHWLNVNNLLLNPPHLTCHVYMKKI